MKWREDQQLWAMLAERESFKSKCSRLHVGCVIAREGRFIAAGVNQVVPGSEPCPAGAHDRHAPGTIVHAEMAAVLSAQRPAYLVGSEAWVTHAPCLPCAMLLVYVGVKHVHFGEHYRDTAGLDLLSSLGVAAEQW